MSAHSGNFSSAAAPAEDAALARLRLPPHSIEAEQSVLGGLMLDNAAWDRIGDRLGADDFYRYEHRLIFQQIGRLIADKHSADVVTVAEALESVGESQQSGGLAYLGEIARNTPSAANIAHYADIVRERAILRQLLTATNEIAEAALNLGGGREAREILDEAESKIFAIRERGARAAEGFVHIDTPLADVVKHLEETSGEDVTGVPTGFIDIDRMTSGLQPGDLIVVAGRPSMGKTAFALNIAEHVAVRERRPVGVFSMEMGCAQLALRLLSSHGGISSQHLRNGRLSEEDWEIIPMSLGALSAAPIYIDESGALNPVELRARARRLKREVERGARERADGEEERESGSGGLGLLVIDYIQLMNSTRQNENRATEVSEISRALKSLAKELHVPVLALSQLSRKVEERNDKRPLMSDLRESGAIEQDADVIMMLYRDEYYKKDESQFKGLAEVIIGKQRNGPTGSVILTFQGEYTRFRNHSAEDL
ncbi:MAG: replicative DNA helicase [Zoogloeaceae bacterium]|jgi:replicative DNA helicase|nr:replicative DNA helicase [Zoogloeaceae bacterium]